jgi:predicted  nucleic acid-binding Zn-ribbon protein
MSEVDEEVSALRRGVRKIEDDIAEIGRKKANNTDIEPVVAKQNALEVFTRTRLEALHSDNEDIRNILKRMAESLASIDDRLTKHKRETDNELQSVKIEKPTQAQRPMPVQLQIALYVLAGVGILTLMQAAPQALLSIFPSVARGGF